MGKGTIGFTCSCFDLLHAGHILMLKDSKKQCDKLIVGLQTNPTLDRPEKNKPIQKQEYKPHVEDIMEYCTLEEIADFLKDDPELNDNERFELYYDERERRKPKEKGLSYNQLLKQSGIKPSKK